jgi:hypothetical protein
MNYTHILKNNIELQPIIFDTISYQNKPILLLNTDCTRESIEKEQLYNPFYHTELYPGVEIYTKGRNITTYFLQYGMIFLVNDLYNTLIPIAFIVQDINGNKYCLTESTFSNDFKGEYAKLKTQLNKNGISSKKNMVSIKQEEFNSEFLMNFFISEEDYDVETQKGIVKQFLTLKQNKS